MSILGANAGAAGSGSLPNQAILSQAIRDSVGVPSTETLGPRVSDSLIGVDPTATLVSHSSFMLVSNESEAQALATNPTGGQSAEDPYIIENLDFDDTTNLGFLWQDTTAFTYHIKLKNVDFSGTYSVGSTRTNCTNAGHTGTLVYENCTFSGPSATHILGLAFNSDITYRRCLFSRAAGGVINLQTFNGTVIFEDCIGNEAGGAWSGTNSIMQDNTTSGTGVYIMRYCKVVGPGGTIDHGCRPIKGSDMTVINSIFSGVGSGIGQGGTVVAGALTVTYCRFVDSINEHILLSHAAGHEISYCDFQDNAADKRQVYYLDSATDIDDVEVHHCKFSKPTGNPLAGNECLESIGASNVKFHDIWVNGCPEDAIEHVRPRTGCDAWNIVGDNVAGQIVDYFDEHATAPGNDSIVHHIYGDCGDVGVLVTGKITVNVSNVHVNTTVDAVRLEQRDSIDIADGPFGCAIYGPIENNLGDRFGTVVGSGSLGAGNTIGGVIGVNSI